NLFGLGAELRPAHVLPFAVDLAARRGALAVGREAAAEELRHRLHAGHLGPLLLHRAHVLFCGCHDEFPLQCDAIHFFAMSLRRCSSGGSCPSLASRTSWIIRLASAFLPSSASPSAR